MCEAALFHSNELFCNALRQSVAILGLSGPLQQIEEVYMYNSMCTEAFWMFLVKHWNLWSRMPAWHEARLPTESSSPHYNGLSHPFDRKISCGPTSYFDLLGPGREPSLLLILSFGIFSPQEMRCPQHSPGLFWNAWRPGSAHLLEAPRGMQPWGWLVPWSPCLFNSEF